MPHYFLGVDGGQSSTYALIGDPNGRVLGRGHSGPSNHIGDSEGTAKFTSAIKDCLSAACAEAGIHDASVRFAACCLGFSGGPADKQAILAEILPSERTIVTDDAVIALSGATGGQPGLIVISGTGSIAFGRNASGKTARAGGWGYIFGDEGSGFYITREALRAALRFEEGWSAPTQLRALLLAATGAADANDLLHRFYTPEFPRPRIADFAKLVDEAAENGDITAREILNNAAEQLATIASAVRKQLFSEAEPARSAYIGGVFRSRMVLERFRALVPAGPPIYGPAAGALLEAYRAAGIQCKLTNVPVEKA